MKYNDRKEKGMSGIQAIDESILLWVQEHIRSDKVTPIIQTLTHLGDFGLLWIGFSLVLMLNKDTRKAGKLSLISICLCFLLNNIILKREFFKHSLFYFVYILNSYQYSL